MRITEVYFNMFKLWQVLCKNLGYYFNQKVLTYFFMTGIISKGGMQFLISCCSFHSLCPIFDTIYSLVSFLAIIGILGCSPAV